jgi:tRNA isopentenyl-2-thiomethyl-A-37 hydroxylase MiaE
MLDIADTAHILKNIQEYLRIKCPVAWVPDTRLSNSLTTTNQSATETAQYQLQITIPDQHTFDMIKNRLFLLIEREVKHQINQNEWQIHIPPEVSQWYHFGQKSGKYSIFYPAEFTQPGDYRISHAICERLLVQPAIMCRLVIQTVINAMGASTPEHTLHYFKLTHTLRKQKHTNQKINKTKTQHKKHTIKLTLKSAK